MSLTLDIELLRNYTIFAPEYSLDEYAEILKCWSLLRDHHIPDTYFYLPLYCPVCDRLVFRHCPADNWHEESVRDHFYLNFAILLSAGWPNELMAQPNMSVTVNMTSGNPTIDNAPLALSSPGATTPRALSRELRYGLSSPSTINNTTQTEGSRGGESLATDLHQLQVRSPEAYPDLYLPPSSDQSSDNIPNYTPSISPVTIPRRQYSSSTESSSNHPYNSSLSEYDIEGFPKSLTMDTNMEEPAADPYTTARVEATISAADEAVMRLNGTDTVHAASSLAQAGPSHPFTLPGGFANFANPHQRGRPSLPSPASRQASTSTTSASTSSEEEDLCVPTLVHANKAENERRSRPGMGQTPFKYNFYEPKAVAPVVMPRASSNGSNGLHRLHSGQGSYGNGYDVTHSPYTGEPYTREPRVVAEEESSFDDDDGDTVGDARSTTKSTSPEMSPPPPKSSYSDVKRKRKADTPVSHGKPLAEKKPAGRRSSVKDKEMKPILSSEPSRKRRRSDLSDSNIDPALQEVESPMDAEEDYVDEDPDPEASSTAADDDEEYTAPGPSRAKMTRGKPARRTAATGSGTASKRSPPKAQTKKAKATSTKSSKAPKQDRFECEYVNPLPPYDKCPDSFTRIYDKPRHMARHANRERDLVAEGRLPLERATTWLEYKDKPVNECPKCHEIFTRKDALKRHRDNLKH